MDVKATYEKAKGFVKGHPKAALALAGLLLLLLGYGFGRFAQPARVVEKERVVTKTVTVEVEKKQDQQQLSESKDVQRQQKVHRVVVETKKPDGETTKTTTEDIGSDSTSHSQEAKVEVRYVDREVTKWQDRVVEKTVEKLAPTNWRVYAGVGVSVPFYLGQGQLGAPNMLGTVVDLGIDRRVAGPFWLGVYSNTQGTIGVHLSAAF